MKHDNVLDNGSGIYLVTMEPRDVSEGYLRWMNDPDVTVHLTTHSATRASLQSYVTRHLHSDDSYLFGIHSHEAGGLIGTVKLDKVDHTAKTAWLGILIGEKSCWGRGYGKAVVALILDFAYTTLSLEQVHLGVTTANRRAIKLYTTTGFVPYEQRMVHSQIRHPE